MAQEQNYQVNYTINVNASPGTRELTKFGEAVGKLVMSKNTMDLTVNNVNTMMKKIDKLFTTKAGKRRSYTYKLHTDTGSTEEKLERIQRLLGEIGEMDEAKAAKTFDYAHYQNTVTVPEITRAAEVYLKAISSPSGAQEFMKTGGFNFDLLSEKGFFVDPKGHWRQKVLGTQATDKEREDQLAGF